MVILWAKGIFFTAILHYLSHHLLIKNYDIEAGHQWLMPVILASWEAEIGLRFKTSLCK
jgi:hypothetical protein